MDKIKEIKQILENWEENEAGYILPFSYSYEGIAHEIQSLLEPQGDEDGLLTLDAFNEFRKAYQKVNFEKGYNNKWKYFYKPALKAQQALTKSQPQNTEWCPQHGYPLPCYKCGRPKPNKVEPQIEGLELTEQERMALTILTPEERFHCEEGANVGIVEGEDGAEQTYNRHLNEAIMWMIAFKVAQAAVKKAYPVIRAKAYKEGWRKGDQFGIDSATEVDDVILEASVRDAIQAERALVAKEIRESAFKWIDNKVRNMSMNAQYKRIIEEAIKSHYEEVINEH